MSDTAKITLIVAAAENNAIGKNNKMLWHLPTDFKYFKNKTSEHSIVMGRKTFESLGKPLPNRRNIVLTRDLKWKADEVDVANSPQEVLTYCRDEREVFIIGGEEIYKLFIEKADKLLITRVHAEFVDADAFFPEFDKTQWTIINEEFHQQDSKNQYDFTFQEFERKS